MEFIDFSGIVLLSSILICLAFQLIYYWIYLFKPYKYQKMREKEDGEIPSSFFPVSVIITGENEAQNLEKYLPSVLEQEYPKFEVIFVNNASTDDTEDTLKRFALKYSHFYHTYIPAGSKNLSRKKLALTVGIKAAKYDKLLFIEPDSYPLSPQWIQRMAANFSEEKKIVLGFTQLKKYPSKYIAFDYFLENIKMMSLALKSRPYTANGHNLAYSKMCFEANKGFSKINFLDLGEDNLLINQIATPKNVSVELSQNSITTFEIKEVSEWKKIKLYQTITSKFYKKFSVLFWRGEAYSRLLFYILLAFNIVYSVLISNWIIFGVSIFAYLLRLITQLIVVNKTASFLKQPKYYITLPLFDIIQPFVDGYFYLYGLSKVRKNYNWKYEKRRR